MTNKPLNTIGQELKARLQQANKGDRGKDEQLINVANVGRVVSLAYEQLRNAAEYTQEHLLRQRAIRRYLLRNLSLHTNRKPTKSVAEELVVELTQSGYVDNDSLPYSILERIHNSVSKHYDNYWRMNTHADKKTAEEWMLDLISVEVESIISDGQKLQAYQYFAFQHYKQTIDREHYADETSSVNYEAALYVAVHRALLKSDLANVRYDLLQLYKYPDSDITEYVKFHKNVSEIYESDLTNQLTRFVDKHGAPLRVMKSMIEEDQPMQKLLPSSNQFLSAFESQVSTEYEHAGKRLTKGLVKSILFLLITKTLIGLLVEIPYDILVTGSIIVLPLVINLVTPIVYLLVLRLGIKLPGRANTEAMIKYIDAALYEGNNSAKLYAKERKTSYTIGFSVVYTIMFLAVFGFVLTRLIMWDFNALQIFLFFIFLATASFLGFRMTHTIRELELVTAKPGIIQAVRDFFYMPFIVVGRWLSEEYKKINFVALILDTVIELPLKTVLRLIRQWTSFISDKKESL